MVEFKSDDHYIYYCGQESLRRNGVVIMAHKRAQNEISLIQFSCSLVSDSLRPHELQHTSLPVHHQLPEFTQTHVHQVSDAIQPTDPLSSPSPPAFNLSQLISR